MTSKTCMTCGHSGTQITDARGFCTQCLNLPSRMPDPAPGEAMSRQGMPLTLPCLRCGTVREIGLDCPKCAGVITAAPAVAGSPAAKKPMSLSVSFFIAAVGTILHWGVLFIFGVTGRGLYELISFWTRSSNAPIANPSVYNQFTVGLIVGGVVATAVGWFLAYRRHPFIGAVLGIGSGSIVTVLYWLA